MKLVIVLFALVAAASAFPGFINQGWQDPWQQQQQHNLWNPWQQKHDPWQQQQNLWNPWQQKHDPWQQNQWQPHNSHHHHHHQEHHHVDFIPQHHSIPPPHPKPLKLKVHDESVKIPYHPPHIHHPHLIGVEAHVPEPEIKVIHKQHHNHGWQPQGWQQGWD